MSDLISEKFYMLTEEQVKELGGNMENYNEVYKNISIHDLARVLAEHYTEFEKYDIKDCQRALDYELADKLLTPSEIITFLENEGYIEDIGLDEEAAMKSTLNIMRNNLKTLKKFLLSAKEFKLNNLEKRFRDDSLIMLKRMELRLVDGFTRRDHLDTANDIENDLDACNRRRYGVKEQPTEYGTEIFNKLYKDLNYYKCEFKSRIFNINAVVDLRKAKNKRQ